MGAFKVTVRSSWYPYCAAKSPPMHIHTATKFMKQCLICFSSNDGLVLCPQKPATIKMEESVTNQWIGWVTPNTSQRSKWGHEVKPSHGRIILGWSFEETLCRAYEMAHREKALAVKPDSLRSTSLNPPGRRREPTSCCDPLTSTLLQVIIFFKKATLRYSWALTIEIHYGLPQPLIQ